MTAIPAPALIVLIGASGSGKSTWAAGQVAGSEIVSSDDLRAVVGSGRHDLTATDDAFALLDAILAARTRRGLTTVVDTLGLDPARRRGYRDLARQHGLPSVAVVFHTAPAVCRRRNAVRDRPVPAGAIEQQLRRMRDVVRQLGDEPWDLVVTPAAVVEPDHLAGSHRARTAQRARPGRLEFVLQLSRFPERTPPEQWLPEIALRAAEVGLSGIALMDHLIQIPQVGRPWEPIYEPWVTLGLLAGLPTALRLGTLVSPVTLRSIGATAKAASTLDVVTGGRAFLGLGAGWWEREHAAFGVPFPPAPARLDALERHAEALRALWAPGTRRYVGEHIALPETTSYPRPVGPLPLIIGGSGERTLGIAARWADASNVASRLEVLDRAREILRRRLEHTDRRTPFALTVLDVPVIGTTHDEVHARVERLRGSVSAAAFARRHHAGVVDDQIGRYRQLAERDVRTVFLALPDLAAADDLDRLAPITAAFAQD
ncbi:MAG: LLM class flavin-dependent oxidoreductase [Actinobacteria bacterium]|nr:LLM class flavin-dependent oxidoreductase [Actinomycetota bacterium]